MIAPAHSSASTTTAHATTAVQSSPVRPSRLRGLSYLRLHPRADAPALPRSTSSPNTTTLGSLGQAAAISTPAQQSTQNSPASGEPTTPTVTRARAATTTSSPTPPSIGAEEPATTATSSSKMEPNPTIRFIPHIETRSARPSLHFTAISKTLKATGGRIRVGRYTEREQAVSDGEVQPVGFKSKVVSRRHCEFWCTNGQWYVKDVKSSSGTFLNHVRLSSPGQESKPFPVNDGDVVQLGIDFKGGEEVIFRCVKIRIECNRGWQKGLNNYNTATHKNLLKTVTAGKAKRDSDAGSVNNHECSICLNPITPMQCLFVAPCSHVWHYKCIRGLVHGPHYPNFLCPNCRFVADLEADVEPPEEEEMIDDMESLHGDEPAADEHAAPAAPGASVMITEAINDMNNSDVSPDSTSDEAGPSSNIDTSSNGGPVTPPRSRPVPMTAVKHQPGNLGLGSTTPGSTNQYTLSTAIATDALLTPRNDAGPFILDGAAGRANGDLHAEGLVAHLRRAADVDESD